MNRVAIAALAAVLIGGLGGCSSTPPGENASFVELFDTTTATTTRTTTVTTSRTTTSTATTNVDADRAFDDDLVPVVGITDGDTIRVRVDGVTERIRIIGIDAPEIGECFAQQASSKMQSLVQSKDVRLTADSTQDDRDNFGRLLRHVWLSDGSSVAEILIAGGYGREYTYDRPYRGQAAYLVAQSVAREEGLGIWSSGCLSLDAPPAPSVQAPPPVSTTSPATTGCLIKGNINSDGEHIYHVPGARYYDETKIDTSRGERWFCSESEAQAAGWRKAKV